jgi:hypothetical protein
VLLRYRNERTKTGFVSPMKIADASDGDDEAGAKDDDKDKNQEDQEQWRLWDIRRGCKTYISEHNSLILQY